jgi:hypothetical protein
MKKFLLYLGRWQLSSIVLWPCILLIPDNALLAAIFSNLVGGCIFFWVDKWIFKK